MTVRKWKDAPEVLEQGESLCIFTLGERQAQVIRVGSEHYITTGNLFSSETIKVGSAADVLRAIGAISKVAHRDGATIDTKKHGWVIMENAE